MPNYFTLNLQRRALLALQRRSSRHLPQHLRTGLRGEFESLFFLRKQGYVVVERRWRTPELNGDVDLIGWDGATLCFVEVKTRTARDRTPAASAVDDTKRRMLGKMARAYARTMPRDQREGLLTRFDLVSVYLLGETVECELVRAAFDGDDF